ncbi:MAG: asparaginase [Nitriliruptoraceae bacterium]|nr:asparaginase [Nitriliruptoraceae bacterium]
MTSFAQAQPEPLVELTRRDERSGAAVVESIHHGHLVLVRRSEVPSVTDEVTADSGEVEHIAALGVPDVAVFVRSLAKPIQAALCLELLGRPDLSAPELAIAWASHRGEPIHETAVRALLARSGTESEALTCPPATAEATPQRAPTRLQHNCSGKHALFAWAGQAIGCERDALLERTGPLQQRVLAALDRRLTVTEVGTDGCGAPAVTGRLDRLAATFASLAVDGWGAPVREAGLAAPLLVGGTGRLESALLAAGVVAKVGAEGSYAVGWADGSGAAWGLAAKAADGATRGSATAVIHVLEALGVVGPRTWREAAPRGGGLPVGAVRPSAALRALIDHAVSEVR